MTRARDSIKNHFDRWQLTNWCQVFVCVLLLIMNFLITKNDFNLFFTITNCQIVCSRSLTNRINYKFMCLSAYWQWKLANEHARISAVIVKLTIIGMSNIKEGRYKLRLHVSVNLFVDVRSPSCATRLYTPTINTASHDNHQKINSWV